MLLFNWNKIFETCKGNASEMVLVLKMLVDKQIPNNRFDRIYKYTDIDFRGESFLLHPDVLLYNCYQYGYKDVCIYAALASLRSYAEYKANGKTTLDVLHLPVDPFIFLNNHSLLRIQHDGIHFLYEEAPTEIH